MEKGHCRENSMTFSTKGCKKPLMNNRKSFNYLSHSRDRAARLYNSIEYHPNFRDKVDPKNAKKKKIFKIPAKTPILLNNSLSIPSKQNMGLSNTLSENCWKRFRAPRCLKSQGIQAKLKNSLTGKVFFDRRTVTSHKRATSESLSLLSGNYSLNKFKNITEFDVKSTSKSHLSATKRREVTKSEVKSGPRSERLSNLYRYLHKKRYKVSDVRLPKDYLRYEEKLNSVKDEASQRSKLTSENIKLFNKLIAGQQTKIREKSLVQSFHKNSSQENQPCKVLDLDKDLDHDTDITQEDGPADPRDVAMMEALERAVAEETERRKHLEQQLLELKDLMRQVKQRS
ncbi:unnamed protein product [Moneuplotes crassus]|uniref:Uncharacterized protein n=1 Tax=Euplotes crassus TaxID=5936 RepID=A0AAD1UNA4_EUPCR|nr:unnamed protein product [Moneuplotes crassus]